jgi:glycosyltransferase involved in cell wall biosynthesis
MIKGHVTILSSAANIADARLHRLTNALITSNITVDVWALGKSEDAPRHATFHGAPGGTSLAARLWRDLVLPFRAEGEIVLTIAPDLLPVTRLVTRLRKQKLVADIFEDYLQLLNDRSWARGIIGRLARIVARYANHIAAQADLTTVADTQVPPFNARTRLVVRNLPDLSMLTMAGTMDSQPRAIYIGDVRTSRGLRTMLSVAELSPNWRFDIVGNVAPADQEFVDSWRSHSDAASRVIFHGRLAPTESWKLARGAWVGLSLLESTPAFLAAVPSKLYEYAACGLPIVSTPLPRCAELISISSAGIVAQTPAQIASAMNSWSDSQAGRAELERMAAHALAWSATHLDSAAEYGAFVRAITALLPA